jgi:hypothetical protein
MDLVGRYDNSSIDIEGSEESLRQLSYLLQHISGAHTLALANSAPQSPYPALAKTLKFEIADDSVCVARSGDEISMRGAPDKFEVLAQNILALADQKQEQRAGQLRLHSHIEYYPGHFFLKAESIPLVITKIEGNRIF